MNAKNVIGLIWLGAISIWLATVLSVSVMNAVVWVTSIGFQTPIEVQNTIYNYYMPFAALTWSIFAVSLFLAAGTETWKTGKFHLSMVDYPIRGLLFTIVASMLRRDAEMSPETFLTVVGVVTGVTILHKLAIPKR